MLHTCVSLAIHPAKQRGLSLSVHRAVSGNRREHLGVTPYIVLTLRHIKALD